MIDYSDPEQVKYQWKVIGWFYGGLACLFAYTHFFGDGLSHDERVLKMCEQIKEKNNASNSRL